MEEVGGNGEKRPITTYPFVKGIFGIPLEGLTAPFHKNVKTGSGREVQCAIEEEGDKAWIEITDPKDDYIMHAVVRGDTMRMDINTRKKNGERHPDFFARRFLIFAYEYFLANGHKIDRISTFWPLSGSKFHSVNYEQYLEILKKGVSPENAVKATWAGRLAGELGFTEVENIVKYESEGLEADFKKPDQT